MDLNEDAELFTFLADDVSKKLSAADRLIKNNNIYISHANLGVKDLQNNIKRFQSNPTIPLRNEITHSFRTLTLTASSAILSTDWQSPSYLHATVSQAGRQTGTIYGGLNDYKRDQHRDLIYYEKKFIKEYVDSPYKPFIRAYATVSGMAALTTIINFLLMYRKAKKVLYGRHTYFQAIELLTGVFGSNAISVDETDPLGDTIRKYKPDAIFLDTISNTKEAVSPDIASVRTLLKHSQTYLVIDNTVTSTGRQFLTNPLLAGRHVIVWESLNKFHQYGLDRVTGGILYGTGIQFENLFDVREHSGTILPDTHVFSIPTPNRKLFDKRLKRIIRNTRILSEMLNIHHLDRPFLTLSQKKLQHTVKLCIENSKKLGVNVAAGTSFGLPWTRVYAVATHTPHTEPFLRIAPGSETVEEIEAIGRVLKKVLDR